METNSSDRSKSEVETSHDNESVLNLLDGIRKRYNGYPGMDGSEFAFPMGYVLGHIPRDGWKRELNPDAETKEYYTNTDPDTGNINILTILKNGRISYNGKPDIIKANQEYQVTSLETSDETCTVKVDNGTDQKTHIFFTKGYAPTIIDL